jgi:hypothetical protein
MDPRRGVSYGMMPRFRHGDMAKIFLSYRRSDSRATAGRIADKLTSRFGKRAVYVDVDDIPFGADFRKAIEAALHEGDVVVAVVGPRWRGEAESTIRIFENTDPVRIEIETALTRGVAIVPILVDGAKMPLPTELPESLRQFPYYNAAEVDDGRDFHQQMDRVLRSIDQVLSAQAKKKRWYESRSSWLVAAGVSLFLGISLSLWPLTLLTTNKNTSDTGLERVEAPFKDQRRSQPEGGGRMALVIGMSNYAHAPKLKYSTGDAAAIAELFKHSGFSVAIRNDIPVLDFRRAIRDFASLADSSEIAVAFFAGHAMELAGTNYLIPTDAKLATDLDVEDEAVTLDRLIGSLGLASKVRIVLLDAAHHNPFARKMRRTSRARSISTGLARVDSTGDNLLVVYSAKAGQLSVDTDGPHSTFTSALLKHIGTPGLDIRLALGRVRDDVLRATGMRQEPFVYGSLGGQATPLVPFKTDVLP